MRRESIFRDTEIIEKALSLNDEVVIKLNTRSGAAEPGTDEFQKLEHALGRIKLFMAGSEWLQGTKARKGIDSRLRIKEGDFLIPGEIKNAILEVTRQVCTTM